MRRIASTSMAAAAGLLVWLFLSREAAPPPEAIVTPQGAAAPEVARAVDYRNQLETVRPILQLADSDPFMPPVAPVPIIKAVAPQLPPPPPAAQLPSQPPLNLRFAGRMTAPDGQEFVYAVSGDAQITLIPGLELPNGYRVTAVTQRAVEFLYTPLNTQARLDLPALPSYEIR